MKPSIIIFDIDGVLANNEHRQHYLTETPPNWNAFFDPEEVIKDEACPLGVILCSGLSVMEGDPSIVFVTGRPRRLGGVTRSWLYKNVVCENAHGLMYMRPDDDKRPSPIIKQEHLLTLLDSYNVLLTIDDDPACCDMYRSHNISTLYFQSPVPHHHTERAANKHLGVTDEDIAVEADSRCPLGTGNYAHEARNFAFIAGAAWMRKQLTGV